MVGSTAPTSSACVRRCFVSSATSTNDRRSERGKGGARLAPRMRGQVQRETWCSSCSSPAIEGGSLETPTSAWFSDFQCRQNDRLGGQCASVAARSSAERRIVKIVA
jgi:hypothetical protein